MRGMRPGQILEALSEHVATTRWEDISADAQDFARLSLVDTLAVMYAGSGADGVQSGVALARHWRGCEESSVAGHGLRLPSPTAAWLNGTMAQARDFDAVHEGGVFHLNSALVPAALSLAEATEGLAGTRLLAAVAVAQDVAVRIAGSFRGPLRWSRTATVGTLSAAIAAASVLGQDAPVTADTIAIATARAAGGLQAVADGSLVKRYLAGFAAEAGVIAALLAGEGITGPGLGLDGPYGFFELYEQGMVDADEVMDGLGVAYRGSETSIKPYPSAREHHGVLELAEGMLRRGLDPDDIAAMEIRLPPTAFAISGRPVSCVPSAPAAIASAAYGVAAAFVRGGVFVANYAEETRRDKRLHELVDRTEVTVCEALPDNPLVPQTLVVSLHNGKQLREECRVLLGSPIRRLSATAFDAKLRTCAEAAITPVSTDRIARFAAAVEDSANCTDVLGEFLS